MDKIGDKIDKKKIIILCLAIMCFGCEEPNMIVLMGQCSDAEGKMCNDDHSYLYCKDGKYTVGLCKNGESCFGGECVVLTDPCANKSCGDGNECVEGECVPVDPCAMCGKDQICRNGKCLACENGTRNCVNNGDMYVCKDNKWVKQSDKVCGVDGNRDGDNKYAFYQCEGDEVKGHRCKNDEACALKHSTIMCNGKMAYKINELCDGDKERDYQKCSLNGEMIFKCKEDTSDNGQYKYMEDKKCDIENGEFCHVNIDEASGHTTYFFYCGVL